MYLFQWIRSSEYWISIIDPMLPSRVIFNLSLFLLILVNFRVLFSIVLYEIFPPSDFHALFSLNSGLLIISLPWLFVKLIFRNSIGRLLSAEKTIVPDSLLLKFKYLWCSKSPLLIFLVFHGVLVGCGAVEGGGAVWRYFYKNP